MKKYLTLLVLALTIFMVGCAKEEVKTSKAKDTVIIATTYDAKTLDPYATNDVASSNIMQQIYNNLVTVDDNGEVIGELAEKIETLDEKTYRFTLRKGVFFHNGEELKASDAIFSLKRAYNEGAAIKHLINTIDLSTIKQDDDYTFSFSLTQPFSPFLVNMAHVGGGVVLNEKAVTEAGADYGFSPVGTGPYKLTEWKKGDEMTLTRFDEFYGEKPYFANMIIRVIPEASIRTVELEAGTVDLAYEMPALEVNRIEKNEDLAVSEVTSHAITYLGFNTQVAPLNDIRVRQAIKYGIDIETDVLAVFKGQAITATGALSQAVNFADETLTVPEYNVEKGKALLAEAGYPDGFSMKVWTNSKKVRVDMATIIKEQLKMIGIDLKIEVLEWGAYLQGLENDEHEMFVIGWTCQSLDPDLGLYPAFHSTGGSNFARFKNAEFDKYLDDSRLTTDTAERAALFASAQQLIVEETPWVPLANTKMAFGYSKNLKGFVPSPMMYHKLYNLRWEE
ncbi:MAG: hypothetical protein JEZ04_19295 [Spirochaetales bacterium]|nr:hypothetical protein [Spirochaetales bacterium]